MNVFVLLNCFPLYCSWKSLLRYTRDTMKRKTAIPPTWNSQVFLMHVFVCKPISPKAEALPEKTETISLQVVFHGFTRCTEQFIARHDKGEMGLCSHTALHVGIELRMYSVGIVNIHSNDTQHLRSRGPLAGYQLPYFIICGPSCFEAASRSPLSLLLSNSSAVIPSLNSSWPTEVLLSDPDHRDEYSH